MLRKFALSEKQYVRVGLNGMDIEICLYSHGKKELVLSADEVKVLSNANPLEEYVYLNTILTACGLCADRKCVPNEKTGGLKFTLMEMTDAQPMDPSEFTCDEYVLSRKSAKIFIESLPKIMDFVSHLENSKEAISLAYQVVEDHMKILCIKNYGSTGPGHFHLVMRLLHQQVPISLLVSDFKKKSAGTMLILSILFKSILSQFNYLYNHVYAKCME